jgi:hypothetical protein
MAGKPRHSERKAKKTVTVTLDSWDNFDEIAREFMISRSELVEQIGQGRLKVIDTHRVA